MRNSMRLKHYMYVDRSHMFISFKLAIKVVRRLFISFHFEKTFKISPSHHCAVIYMQTSFYVCIFYIW